MEEYRPLITPDPLPIKVALTNIWTSPAWLVYGIATMQVGKYASRQINKWKFRTVQLCKNQRLQVWKRAIMICESMQVCKKISYQSL